MDKESREQRANGKEQRASKVITGTGIHLFTFGWVMA
jgi:hypothetical protein